MSERPIPTSSSSKKAPINKTTSLWESLRGSWPDFRPGHGTGLCLVHGAVCEDSWDKVTGKGFVNRQVLNEWKELTLSLWGRETGRIVIYWFIASLKLDYWHDSLQSWVKFLYLWANLCFSLMLYLTWHNESETHSCMLAVTPTVLMLSLAP